MPANAEIVLEGEMVESVKAKEGPFGEFTGYYASSPSEQPVVEVKRVYYRNDPILGIASPMRPPSDFSSKCVMKAGMIWDEVERAGLSGVAGVWVHEFGGARMFNVIAIKQAYPGHARQAGFLAASCQSGSYLGRFVVVVDEDVDPSDLFDVMWAICTRCDPPAHRLKSNGRAVDPLTDRQPANSRHHRRLPAVRAAQGFTSRVSPTCRSEKSPTSWQDRLRVERLAPHAIFSAASIRLLRCHHPRANGQQPLKSDGTAVPRHFLTTDAACAGMTTTPNKAHPCGSVRQLHHEIAVANRILASGHHRCVRMHRRAQPG
jgi:hypothetical protein